MYLSYFKRTIDVLFAIIAIMLLLPIFLVLAILIKLFDSGPVIFRQPRVGRHGETFTFFKFRSMPVNTADIASDLIGQVELTWVGRFLRRTNLDEIPQLYNILRGDMSIVGPRPSLLSQTELIAIRKQLNILSLRPGLTGWTQVNGYDGMTVASKAELDKAYLDRVSALFDLQIVLRTFLYLSKPPPVY